MPQTYPSQLCSMACDFYEPMLECVYLCVCTPEKNDCCKAITCLKWWPNYDSLLQHAALQNQTPWNWLPAHLDLICDSTLFSPSPCHRLSCRALFISTGNKRFKHTRMQSNGILNPGCRGNNCVGRQKKKMLGELISAERWETSYNSFFQTNLRQREGEGER